jgi:hypothetical protein
MRKLYAVEVGATRTRSTIYYRIFSVGANRNLVDETAAVCKAMGETMQPVYKALRVAGRYGALHEIGARIGVRLNETVSLDQI